MVEVGVGVIAHDDTILDACCDSVVLMSVCAQLSLARSDVGHGFEVEGQLMLLMSHERCSLVLLSWLTASGSLKHHSKRRS